MRTSFIIGQIIMSIGRHGTCQREMGKAKVHGDGLLGTLPKGNTMEERLDLTGLSCPIPVIKANKAIRQMTVGDVLVCEVTDPAAPEDFENFCASTGHQLMSCENRGTSWVLTIKLSA